MNLDQDFKALFTCTFLLHKFYQYSMLSFAYKYYIEDIKQGCSLTMHKSLRMRNTANTAAMKLLLETEKHAY